jgi:hypothetical protein
MEPSKKKKPLQAITNFFHKSGKKGKYDQQQQQVQQVQHLPAQSKEQLSGNISLTR